MFRRPVNLPPLASGTAVAKASLSVWWTLVLTADTAGTAGNSIRFKFTSGATAGSEAITVSSSDITVRLLKVCLPMLRLRRLLKRQALLLL
jgi:hypothetical protein